LSDFLLLVPSSKMHIQNIGSKSRAFINHKPFHPGNFKNVEAVWQLEEDKRNDEKRAKERAAIRAEEAKVEALKGQLRQFESGGLTSKNQSVHGLDWMYENPADAERQTEENNILLGKVEATAQTRKRIERKHGALDDVEGPDLALKEDIGLEVNEDTLRKMREDPLFVIKLADQKYKEKMMANPYTRDHILTREENERRTVLSESSKGRTYLMLEDQIKELREKVKKEQSLIDDVSQKRLRVDQLHHRKSHQVTKRQMSSSDREKRLADMKVDADNRDDAMRVRAEKFEQERRREEELEKEAVLKKLLAS